MINFKHAGFGGFFAIFGSPQLENNGKWKTARLRLTRGHLALTNGSAPMPHLKPTQLPFRYGHWTTVATAGVQGVVRSAGLRE
jgi:hypothetical protein